MKEDGNPSATELLSPFRIVPHLDNLVQDAVSSHQRRHREEARAQQVAASSSVSAAQSMASSAGGRYQYAPSSMGENASSNSKSLGDASISNGGPPPRDSGPRSLPSGGYAANQIGNQINATGGLWTPAHLLPTFTLHSRAGLLIGGEITSLGSQCDSLRTPISKALIQSRSQNS